MILTLLLALASVLAAQQPAAVPELTAPEVYVSIRPSSFDTYQLLRRRTPETFTCSASVTQAETHHLYVAAELVLRAGESDKVTRTEGEYTLDFAVTMKKQRADTLVTVKRGEKVLTRQRSTMYLQTPEGVVPLH